MTVGVMTEMVSEGTYSCTSMESDYAEYKVTVSRKDGCLVVCDPYTGELPLDKYIDGLTDLVMFKIG